MTVRTRTDVLLLAGFCAFLFFYGMGSFGLIGADEPRYAQVAREMLEHRDWITPTLAGHAWLEKPPLYYWQAMLAYSVLGVNDVAARVPSALDATFLVIAAYLFFRRSRSGLAGDAALMIASCAAIVGYARAASTDMPLAASFGIGMLAWWAWRESEKKIYLALFYFFMALGMLAKGPVAPFLAALIIFFFALGTHESKWVLKTIWLPGVTLFCSVALPWYIAVQIRNPQFFREFILEHNFARFATNLYHHPEPFWYYVPVILLSLVPWTVFVIAALVRPVRIWWTERKLVAAEPEVAPDLEFELSLFAAIWLIAPVVFFSFSSSKLPGYVLPAVPAGGLLLAEYLRELYEDNQQAPKWMVLVHGIVAAAPVTPALLMAYLMTLHHWPLGRPLYFAIVVALILYAGIVLTLFSRIGMRMARFVTLVAVVLTVAAVVKFGSSAIDQTLSARPLAMELTDVETHKLPLAICGASRELEFGLNFYRNQTVARYELGDVPPQAHLLIAAPTWQAAIADHTSGRRVLLLGHYAPQNVDYYWVSALNN